jgi:hypothetical protein
MSIKFIIYDTEAEALAKAEEEGRAQGLAYYVDGIGSRYVSYPYETNDNKFALPVDCYISLTETEESSLVDTFTPKETS